MSTLNNTTNITSIYNTTSAIWSEVDLQASHPPSGRSSVSSTVYPPHTLIVQGGCQENKLGPCLSNDVFELSLLISRSLNATLKIPTTYRAMWRQSILSSTCPGKRTSGAMTYVPNFSESRLLILYGGNYGDYAGPLGQIALQDITETWTAIQPSISSNTNRFAFPDARQMANLIPIYNPFNSTRLFDIYMFGGTLTPRTVSSGSK